MTNPMDQWAQVAECPACGRQRWRLRNALGVALDALIAVHIGRVTLTRCPCGSPEMLIRPAAQDIAGTGERYTVVGSLALPEWLTTQAQLDAAKLDAETRSDAGIPGEWTP